MYLSESDEEAARLEYLALASDEELQDLKSTLKRASLLLRPTLIRQQQRLAKEENAGGPPSPTLAADPAILELLSFVSEKQKARWAALGEDATGLDEYDLDLIKLVTSLQRPSTFITDPTSPTLTAANATQGLTESSSIPFNELSRYAVSGRADRSEDANGSSSLGGDSIVQTVYSPGVAGPSAREQSRPRSNSASRSESARPNVAQPAPLIDRKGKRPVGRSPPPLDPAQEYESGSAAPSAFRESLPRYTGGRTQPSTVSQAQLDSLLGELDTTLNDYGQIDPRSIVSASAAPDAAKIGTHGSLSSTDGVEERQAGSSNHAYAAVTAAEPASDRISTVVRQTPSPFVAAPAAEQSSQTQTRPTVLFEGLVSKKREDGKLFGKWRKGTATLFERELTFVEAKSDDRHHVVMSITPETIAKSKGMHAFEVVNPSHGGNGSTWIFTVDTDEEVRNWISNIRRAVAGIKSFSPSADFGLMDDAEKRPPPTQQSYGDRPLSVGPALPLTSSLQLSEDLDVDSQVRIQRKLQDQLEQQRSQQGSWSEDSVPKAPSSSQSGETGVKFQAAISPQQHLQQHGVHLSSSTPERTIFQPAAPPHRGPLSAADGPRVSSNASQTAANAGTVLPVSYLPKSSSQRGPQNPLQSTKSGGVQGPPPVQQNFALVPQPSSQYSSTSSLPTRSPGVQHSQMKGLIPGVVESTNLQTQGAAYPTRSPGPQHAAMMQGGRSPGPQLSMMHPSGTIPSRNPGSQPPNSFSDPNLATRSPGPQNAVMAYGGGMLSSRSPGPMHGTLQHPLRASENYGPPQTGSSALASDSPSPQYAAMPAKSPATRLAQMSISSGSFQAKSPAQQLSQMQPRISQGQWGQTNLPTRSPGPQYGQMQALGADVGQSPMVHSVVMNRAPGLIAPNSTVQQELEQQYRFQPNPQDLLMNQQRGSQNPPLRQTDPGFAAVQTQAHTEQIAWQNSSQFSRNQLQVQPQFQQEPQSQPQQQFQPQQHLQQQLQLQLQVQQNQISQGQLPVQPETFNPNFSSIQQRPGGPMQIQVGPRRSLDNQAGIGHNGPLSAPAIQDGIRNGFGGPMSAANPVRASLAYSPALRPQAFAHNMMQQQQMQHQHMQLQQIQQQQTQQQRVGISQLVRSSSMQGSPAYIAQMALLRQHEEQQRQQQIAQMQQQQQLQQLQQASQEQQLLMQQYQLQQQIQHQLQLQQQMQDFQHNFDQRQNLQLQSQGFAMPNSLGPRSASAYAGGVGTVNSAAPLWPGGNINGMGSRIETPSSVPSGMNFNASVGLSLGTPGMDGSFGPGLSSGMGNMDMLTSMAPKRPVSTSVAAYGNVPSATYRRPSTGQQSANAAAAAANGWGSRYH